MRQQSDLAKEFLDFLALTYFPVPEILVCFDKVPVVLPRTIGSAVGGFGQYYGKGDLEKSREHHV